MRYDTRNRATLNELAPNTKAAALKWYEYCVKNGIEILIYDARRTEAEQRDNVARGVSQTMKSYHLVGQALDFVPVDPSTGRCLWGVADYLSPKIRQAVAYAKDLGFTYGGDWTSFKDYPHLQFNYKGYGTDLVLESRTVYYITGGFPEESEASEAFEAFMQSRKWWYRKEVQK